MKNEIVWVYGSSAAGKETFIRHMLDNPSDKLLKTLGWLSKSIGFCQESIEYIAQYENDPVGDKREEIISIVTNLAKTHQGVILIKGQDLDLEHNRLKRIKKNLPDWEHKIVFLHADIDILHQRFKQKSWWDDSLNKQTVIDWLRRQLGYLNDLNDEFEVMALDSSKPGMYSQISFPPKLS